MISLILAAAAAVAPIAPVVNSIGVYAYDMGTCEQMLRPQDTLEFKMEAAKLPAELKEPIMEAYELGVEDAKKYPYLIETCLEAIAESSAAIEKASHEYHLARIGD